jgi:hypothetical protein
MPHSRRVDAQENRKKERLQIRHDEEIEMPKELREAADATRERMKEAFESNGEPSIEDDKMTNNA